MKLRYRVKKAANLKDLESFERHCGDRWLFRGVRDACWNLESTLDRVPWPKKRWKLEAGLVRKFQRHGHLYDTIAPKMSSIMEWLALMQHYGAPTRLLDFTYSFWVAVFMACEKQGKEDAAAVWAVDWKWLKKRRLQVLSKKVRKAYDKDKHCRRSSTFKRVYGKRIKTKLVIQQNAFRLNERHVIQQGVFLCPTVVEKSFEENLRAMAPTGKVLRKLIIPASLGTKVRKRLWRMNMTSAVLYPGLDGFARSLAHMADLPDVLAPHGLLPLGHEE